MKPTDLPHHLRPLARRTEVPPGQQPDDAGVPPGYGRDSDARQPAELLDQLRQRLSRLADNHPSAHSESVGSCRSGDWSQAQDSPRAPDSPGAPEGREWQGVDGVADLPDEQAVDGGDARVPPGPDGSSEHEPADAGGMPDAESHEPLHLGHVMSAAADGYPGDLDLHLGLSGPSETYRPWFMSGDSGSPWFVTDEGS